MKKCDQQSPWWTVQDLLDTELCIENGYMYWVEAPGCSEDYYLYEECR